MKGIFLVIAAFVFACPAVLAQQPANDGPRSSKPIVQTAPEDAASRQICKTEKETGSRVKRNKVCKTKQEWDEMRNNSSKQLDDYGKQTPPNPLPSAAGG